MRIKKLSMLLALMLTISAITFPLTAYAAGEKDTAPPQVAASLEGGTLKITSSDDSSGVEAVYVDGNRVNSLTNGAASVILKDYAGTGKQVSVYAVDYAGNRSEAVTFDNPYYEEPEETKEIPAASTVQTQSSAAAVRQVQASSSTGTGASSQAASTGSASSSNASSGTNASASGTSGQTSSSGGTSDSASSNNDSSQESTSAISEGAFTPDGTGTVLDSATDAEGDKQFYTITTEAGNVFYLIVDGKRDSNNVYFLNGVTEEDLMALAEKSDGSVSVIPAEETCTCTDKCEAGEVNTNCPVCKNDRTGCTGKEKPAETEKAAEPEETKKDSNNIGTIIFVIAALLAIGGAGYYVKIVRPKQQAEDDEDFDDGYGDGFDPDEAYGEPEYLSEDDFDDKDSE